MSLLSELLADAPRSRAAGCLVDDIAPALLWYIDQPLWMSDPSMPGNIAHNYPIALRIRGSLNYETLEHSLSETIRRHRPLRSVFQFRDSEIAHVTMPLAPTQLTFLDLSRSGKQAIEQEAQHLAVEEAMRPFDLCRGPMIRPQLLRLSAEDHILLLITHHAVCDDWSAGTLVSDLFTIYAAYRSGKPSPLPELTYQYGDFCRRTQERLRNGSFAPHLAFWSERITDRYDFHHVPTDRARPNDRTYRGGHHIARFPELGTAIKMLSRRERVTPFMVMLAALQCLLYRYSGDEEIGVGSCVANRALAETEPLVGPLGNVVVLGVHLTGDTSLRDVLLRAKDTTLSAYSFQDLPFGSLVKHLRPTSNRSRNPLFQTLIVFRNAPRKPWPPSDISVAEYPIAAGSTRYELNWWLNIDSGFEVDLQYNSDLFEAETIKRLVANYRGILQEMAQNPGARINDLHLPQPVTSEHCRSVEPPSVGNRIVLHAQQFHSPQSSSGLDPVEANLIRLWKAALGISEVDVNADFFSMGGDSLRAAQLANSIQQTFGFAGSLELPLVCRNIREQAQAIRDRQSDRCATPVMETTKKTASAAEHLSAGPCFGKRYDIPRKTVPRRVVNRILHLLCRVMPGATTLRPFLHRLRGVKIGKNVWIGDDVYLENEFPEQVEIQDGAAISLKCVIVAHTHGVGKIVIGADAYIGTGAVILTPPNHTLVIGAGAVVAATSLVNTSVHAHTLYGPDCARARAHVTTSLANGTYEEFVESLRPLSP